MTLNGEDLDAVSRSLDRMTSRRFMQVDDVVLYPRAWDRRPRLWPLLAFVFAIALIASVLTLAFSALLPTAGSLHDLAVGRSAVSASSPPTHQREDPSSPASEAADVMEHSGPLRFTTQVTLPCDDPAAILATIFERDPASCAVIARVGGS